MPTTCEIGNYLWKYLLLKVRSTLTLLPGNIQEASTVWTDPNITWAVRLSGSRNQNILQLLMNQAPQKCSVSDIKADITKILSHGISVFFIRGSVNGDFQFPTYAWIFFLKSCMSDQTPLTSFGKEKHSLSERYPTLCVGTPEICGICKFWRWLQLVCLSTASRQKSCASSGFHENICLGNLRALFSTFFIPHLSLGKCMHFLVAVSALLPPHGCNITW